MSPPILAPVLEIGAGPVDGAAAVELPALDAPPADLCAWVTCGKFDPASTEDERVARATLSARRSLAARCAFAESGAEPYPAQTHTDPADPGFESHTFEAPVAEFDLRRWAVSADAACAACVAWTSAPGFWFVDRNIFLSTPADGSTLVFSVWGRRAPVLAPTALNPTDPATDGAAAA